MDGPKAAVRGAGRTHQVLPRLHPESGVVPRPWSPHSAPERDAPHTPRPHILPARGVPAAGSGLTTLPSKPAPSLFIVRVKRSTELVQPQMQKCTSEIHPPLETEANVSDPRARSPERSFRPCLPALSKYRRLLSARCPVKSPESGLGFGEDRASPQRDNNDKLVKAMSASISNSFFKLF